MRPTNGRDYARVEVFAQPENPGRRLELIVEQVAPTTSGWNSLSSSSAARGIPRHEQVEDTTSAFSRRRMRQGRPNLEGVRAFFVRIGVLIRRTRFDICLRLPGAPVAVEIVSQIGPPVKLEPALHSR